jgi:hypothetical protein
MRARTRVEWSACAVIGLFLAIAMHRQSLWLILLCAVALGFAVRMVMHLLSQPWREED